jgi:hypothetical protein
VGELETDGRSGCMHPEIVARFDSVLTVR